MKCIICKKTINPRRERYSHWTKRKPGSFTGGRKFYGCKACEKQFDEWIDAQPEE